jgi:hypothetical protein
MARNTWHVLCNNSYQTIDWIRLIIGNKKRVGKEGFLNRQKK